MPVMNSLGQGFPMAKQKKESSHNVTFAQGGKTKMFGPQVAGSEKAGVTAHDVSGGAPGDKYACGGKTKMFGFAGSQPAQAGITSAR